MSRWPRAGGSPEREKTGSVPGPRGRAGLDAVSPRSARSDRSPPQSAPISEVVAEIAVEILAKRTELVAMVGPPDLGANRGDGPTKRLPAGEGHRDVRGAPILRDRSDEPASLDELHEDHARRRLIHLELLAEISQWHRAAAVRGERQKKRLLLKGDPGRLGATRDRVVQCAQRSPHPGEKLEVTGLAA